MLIAKKHIPGWASDARDPPPPSVAVRTVDDLLEVEWIKSWREHPKFFRYAISWHRELPMRTPPLLLVELDEGREWWVLAYLNDSPLLAALPEWRAPSSAEAKGPEA